MDIVVNLPECKGNTHILTIVDVTRYAWARPMPDRKATMIARALAQTVLLVPGTSETIARTTRKGSLQKL